MTITPKPARPGQPHGPLPRRNFLAASLLGATATLLAGAASGQSNAPGQTASADPAPDTFMEVSQLLTGHALNGGLADRAWQALVAREQDFAQRFQQLQKAITQAGLHDMQHWNSSAVAADAGLKATAQAIVSAWYLGVVGEVKDRAEDGPAFITYESALMWSPTSDVTVIPTYARGGPGYWKARPATVATD